MKSPFPGMDPYLESRWRDVHSRMAYLASDQLAPQLPPALRARIEETFVIETDEEGRPRRVSPDTAITETRRPAPGTGSGAGGVGVAEPLVVTWEVEASIQRSVRIVDTTRGQRVVTAIEFLSPTNKLDVRERRAYRRKQRDLLDGGASLVEIDLIRSGNYILYPPEVALPSDIQVAYLVSVTRGWDEGTASIYPIGMRDRLPVIRVPLREADPVAFLDIQRLIDDAYAGGRYDDIDYAEDPDPPLTGEDATWADQLLRQQGKR
jgi:hypothetical protein